MKLSLKKRKYFLIFPSLLAYNHLFLLPLKLQKTGISSWTKKNLWYESEAERTMRRESHVSLSGLEDPEQPQSNLIHHSFAKVDLKCCILLPCYQMMTVPEKGRGHSCKMCCSSISNYCRFISLKILFSQFSLKYPCSQNIDHQKLEVNHWNISLNLRCLI